MRSQRCSLIRGGREARSGWMCAGECSWRALTCTTWQRPEGCRLPGGAGSRREKRLLAELFGARHARRLPCRTRALALLATVSVLAHPQHKRSTQRAAVPLQYRSFRAHLRTNAFPARSLLRPHHSSTHSKQTKTTQSCPNTLKPLKSIGYSNQKNDF